MAAGLALNPGTPVEKVLPYLGECDVVLVMSVEPGFGGQKFLPEVLGKVRTLKQKAPPRTRISIDGGISRSTIRSAAAAGAEIFVAGSAIFDETDFRAALEELASLARVDSNEI
jgi:ribulose-phosphate 3-epimerase